MSHEQHKEALLPLLREITAAAPTEADQWILLESLCLGIGKLHGRTPRQTAEFVDAIAERFTTGERQ